MMSSSQPIIWPNLVSGVFRVQSEVGNTWYGRIGRSGMSGNLVSLPPSNSEEGEKPIVTSLAVAAPLPS